jgi:hypothetical protein
MQQKTPQDPRPLSIPMFFVSFAGENGQMNTLQDIQGFFIIIGAGNYPRFYGSVPV